MTTFLVFIGIIGLLILGKFIYDTYLTNNTENDWKKYAEEEPENAARIERNTGLDFRTKSKSNSTDKSKSLQIIASNLDCLPTEVKTRFHLDLKEQGFGKDELMLMVKELPKKKYDESLALNIDPEDTPSSFIESWIKEYLITIDDKEASIKSTIENVLADNPDLNKVVKQGGNIEEYLDQNRDVFDSLMDSIAYADQAAEKYRLKAIDKMFDEKDYRAAIVIINQGLQLNDKKTEPFLFSLRADCYLKLNEDEEALKDINNAIHSIKMNKPSDFYNLGKFHENLFDFHFERKNFGNAMTSINQALEIAESEEKRSYSKYNYLKKRAKLHEALGNLGDSEKDKQDSQKYYKIWVETEKDDNALPF